MKVRLLISALVSVMLVLAACEVNQTTNGEVIEGTGNVITTDRPMSGFSNIQINMGADLILTQGDSENLSIRADDNLMQYIETEVRQGWLIVSKPDNISLSPSESIQLSLAFETLSAIEIRGQSAINADNLELDRLSISFDGSGSTMLAGRVDNQEIIIRGQAMIYNFDLISQQVDVDISGNSTVEVHAEDSLNVTIAGMGNIRYTGDPNVTQNISGAGTVTRVQ